jgi:YidC/Oxa1 family membrane protein insertase
MTEQGKRLLLAAVIAVGVLFAWNAAFPPKKDPPKPDVAAGSGSAAAVVVPPQSPVGVAVAVPGDTAARLAEAPRGPEQKLTLNAANFVATFSSWGGGLKSWQLTDPRYMHDVKKGEMIPQFDGASALQLNFVNSTYVVPKNAEWFGERLSDSQVRYSYQTDKLSIVKTYTIYPDVYLLRLNIEVKVLADGEARQTLALSVYGYQDPNLSGGGGQSVKSREWDSSTRRDGTLYSTPPKSLKVAGRVETNIDWTGFTHPYLLLMIAPRKAPTEQIEKHTYTVATTDGLMQTDIWFPTAMLTKATPLAREAVAYLGPNNYNKLKDSDEVAGYATGFHGVVDLGWFKFIGSPLLSLLRAIYGVVGNWGIAIIILTFMVKLATLYWTTKSMRSMKAMGALAPKMKELSEKYKGDRQRLQQEQMALYKQHGVNPLAGCLPMLLQMPIWIALYRMLASAGELYLQPFGWINDLTNTDPKHILPVLFLIAQFVQTRLTPNTSTDATQRIMMTVMPLAFGAMSFLFPAGLTLYMFTNTVLGSLHSVYMNKVDGKGKVAVVAAVDTSKASSKAPVVEVAKSSASVTTASEPAPVKNGTAAKQNTGNRSGNKSKGNKRR